MKIAQFARNCLAAFGIRRNQNLANVNFLVAELIFFTTVASEVFSLFYEADTFREYTSAVHWISTYSMVAVCFTLFGKCRAHIFKMMDLGEEIIEMSAYIPMNIFINFNEFLIVLLFYRYPSQTLSIGSKDAPNKIAIYENTNRMADKWSRFAFIVVAKVTPILYLLPNAIYSYFMYFTTDLGNDAFSLPHNIW